MSYTPKLSPDEMFFLDGKCGEEVQAIVDQAKLHIETRSKYESLTDEQAEMLSEIIKVAKQKGRLTYRTERISRCPCCKRCEGYHKYPRNSRYHRKGEPNYDRPILFSGYDLDRGFVTMKNTIFVGYCDQCKPQIEPILKQEIEGIKAEIPKELGGTNYRRYDKKHCEACDWEGHEGELKPLPTLFGDGKYPGECPSCGEQNRPFSPAKIKTVDGFVLVETDK